MTLTPEQREKLTPEQSDAYDKMAPEEQVRWDAIIEQAQRLEAMSADEKIELLMGLVSQLIQSNNTQVERTEQLIGIVNHHSQVIQLVLTAVNGGSIAPQPTPAPESSPTGPLSGAYL